MKTTGKKLLSFFAIAMIAAIAFTSCKKDEDTPEPMTKDNIVMIAQNTPSLSTLVQALTKFPDLVNALSADGNFTVFAPTNDAFAALLGVVGQTSLNDIPEDVLKRILQYHVVAGASLKAADLSDGQQATHPLKRR